VPDHPAGSEAVDALLCIALVSELAPILGQLHAVQLRSHRLCVGRIGELRVGVLRCGVGPDASFRRTRAALTALHPRSVWSVGSCGAVVDDLPVGTLLTSRLVRGPGGHAHAVDPVPDFRAVPIQTVARPVFTLAHRDEVARTGAVVCEMEAAAVARAVGGRVPVHVWKVVSDKAGGEPDPALIAGQAVAMARFHARVERLVRTRVAPKLMSALQAALAQHQGSAQPAGPG
jgi:nucleoside phosphorylase